MLKESAKTKSFNNEDERNKISQAVKILLKRSLPPIATKGNSEGRWKLIPEGLR